MINANFPTPFGKLINQDLTLVFGFFGAWKTFYTVMQAYEAYKRWDIVVSNMWLAFPHIRWYVGEELPPIVEEIQTYHDTIATPFYAPNSYKFSHWITPTKSKPRRFFILIDEGSIFFNARNFKKNFDNPKMLEFFVQPRKFDCSIAIICQDLKMIDVNFSRLAQEVVEFRKWIGGLFRLGESFDTKFIDFDSGVWQKETPVKRRKFYVHPYYTNKSRLLFFGGLYYTKEILGERAIRRDEHIKSLKDYLFYETTNPHFHDWDKNFKLAKQQIFWISEKEKIQDAKNALKK